MNDPSAVPVLVTVPDMLKLAKKLRIDAYYDIGDSEHEEDVVTTAVRQGRSQALRLVADHIDNVFGFTSELTQEDLQR